MPTWWMLFQFAGSGPKNSRSPGIIEVTGTGVVARYCGRAVRGRATPARAYAVCTSPEQSYVFGPSAPHTYGFPSCAMANWTARSATGDAAPPVSSMPRR
jgi:hypothetical protein